MTSAARLGIATRVPTASVKRLEDPRLLTGHGCYLDDIRLPGLLHAAFVRSPHAHARLIDVEAAAALAMTGVVAAITGQDLAGRVAPLAPRLDADGFAATAWPGLAGSRVRFVGEPVAVVAAGTPYAALDGCERVVAGYEPLPALAHVEAALAPGAPALHETAPGNVLFRQRSSHGDVGGAFARAAVHIRERFTHGRCGAVPLEPRGLVARWDEGHLTVWTGTQAPFIYRTALARAFGLAENRVRVIVPDTGGGFGQKMHVMPEDLAVATLARAVGRPVKWTETRRENLAAASHAREARVELEAAADADGVLLGLRARVVSDAGAYHIYPATQALEPLGTSVILPGPYRTPTYAYECVAVATNKPPLGAYRGVGMAFGAFVMERMLDLLADRLGMDPAEIRRRNLIPRDAYPFASAGGLVYDSGDLGKALEEALALAGYERLKRERDEARRRGRLLGVGIACYTEYTGMGSDTYRRRGMVEVPGPEAARVEMHEDASVSCFVSFPSQGQGHRTTIAQLVAAELGVPLPRVNVLQPDTKASPPGTGTFASRGAVAQGGTAQRAAAAVRAKILALAAHRLEVHVDDLELRAGNVLVRGVPARTVAVAEIARLAHVPLEGFTPGLEATESFDPSGAAFSGAVHVAVVEVDADTRRVSVRDYAVVEDCGPVINPMIVEGQIHGAVAQGIGEALGEELVYDATGQLVTGTLMDYAVPVAGALPSFAVGHLETPSPHTPGGMKGMGEGGTVGASAAIANAVADALRPLGVPITSLPIRPEALRPGKESPDMAHRSRTTLVTAGRDRAASFDFVNPPVVRGSTVLFDSIAAMEDRLRRRNEGQDRPVAYGTQGSPTHHAFCDALTELEGGHATCVVPTGLAACTIPILAYVQHGDHILVPDSVYFPTRRFCRDALARLGVEATFYDPRAGAELEEFFRPRTRVLFLESPGSLTFEMQDVPLLASIARRHGAVSIMDNTWATPLYFQPLRHGVDVSVHAATKYIGGHSDLLLGTVTCTAETWPRMRETMLHYGLTTSPDDCWLALRGLRSMAARLVQHRACATRLIEWLHEQPEVQRVLYPALPEDPGHALWKRDMTGASGLFGIALKPMDEGALLAMLDGLTLFGRGGSWGGYESLVTRSAPERTIRPAPSAGPLIRISAGLEDVDDLVDDLRAGFDRLRAHGRRRA